MLLLWLLVVLSLSRAKGSSPEIGFQVHSYNDLGSVEALIKRGARWFKYDIHFVSGANCEKFAALNCSAEYGGLLLSHNDPTDAPEIRYFSAYDLVEIYTKYAKVLPNISVALCGKADWPPGKGPCDDSAYLQLMDAFVGKLQQLQKSHPGYQFILDGSLADLDHGSCMADRYQPWQATWQGTPPSAFWSNKNASDNSSTDYRYQILDTPILDSPLETFLPLVLLDYGKFHKQSVYPYLVWEPSDQSIIQEVSSYYSLGAAHLPQGLRFAINISPERFQIFNAKESGTAWNQPLGGTSGMEQPHLFVVSSSRMVLFAWNSSDVLAMLLSFNHWYGDIVVESITVAPSSSDGLRNLQSVSQMNSTAYLVCDIQGRCVDLSTNGLVCSWGTIQAPPMPLETTFSVIGANESKVSLTASNDCGLLVKGSICAAPAGTNVTGASGVLISQDEVFVVFAADLCLYSAFVTLSTGYVTKPVKFGVGSDVSVSLQSNMAMVTANDGFCWNSEAQNKEVVRFCESAPTSTPGVLIYFFGSIDSWRENDGVISSCNPNIFTASFDQGSSSQISLFFDSSVGEIRVVESHIGATEQIQYAPCGKANVFDGIVIDSFKLPEIESS